MRGCTGKGEEDCRGIGGKGEKVDEGSLRYVIRASVPWRAQVRSREISEPMHVQRRSWVGEEG